MGCCKHSPGRSRAQCQPGRRPKVLRWGRGQPSSSLGHWVFLPLMAGGSWGQVRAGMCSSPLLGVGALICGPTLSEVASVPSGTPEDA